MQIYTFLSTVLLIQVLNVRGYSDIRLHPARRFYHSQRDIFSDSSSEASRSIHDPRISITNSRTVQDIYTIHIDQKYSRSPVIVKILNINKRSALHGSSEESGSSDEMRHSKKARTYRKTRKKSARKRKGKNSFPQEDNVGNISDDTKHSRYSNHNTMERRSGRVTVLEDKRRDYKRSTNSEESDDSEEGDTNENESGTWYTKETEENDTDETEESNITQDENYSNESSETNESNIDTNETGTDETEETQEHSSNKSRRFKPAKIKNDKGSGRSSARTEENPSLRKKNPYLEKICPEEGFFPDLYTCQKFHYCGKFNVTHHTCPSGVSYYDPVRHDCTNARQRNCYRFNCYRQMNRSMAYEGDKQIYATCIRNRAFSLKRCPKGMLFVEKYQECQHDPGYNRSLEFTYNKEIKNKTNHTGNSRQNPGSLTTVEPQHKDIFEKELNSDKQNEHRPSSHKIPSRVEEVNDRTVSDSKYTPFYSTNYGETQSTKHSLFLEPHTERSLSADEIEYYTLRPINAGTTNGVTTGIFHFTIPNPTTKRSPSIEPFSRTTLAINNTQEKSTSNSVGVTVPIKPMDTSTHSEVSAEETSIKSTAMPTRKYPFSIAASTPSSAMEIGDKIETVAEFITSGERENPTTLSNASSYISKTGGFDSMNEDMIHSQNSQSYTTPRTIIDETLHRPTNADIVSQNDNMIEKLYALSSTTATPVYSTAPIGGLVNGPNGNLRTQNTEEQYRDSTSELPIPRGELNVTSGLSLVANKNNTSAIANEVHESLNNTVKETTKVSSTTKHPLNIIPSTFPQPINEMKTKPDFTQPTIILPQEATMLPYTADAILENESVHSRNSDGLLGTTSVPNINNPNFDVDIPKRNENENRKLNIDLMSTTAGLQRDLFLSPTSHANYESSLDKSEVINKTDMSHSTGKNSKETKQISNSSEQSNLAGTVVPISGDLEVIRTEPAFTEDGFSVSSDSKSPSSKFSETLTSQSPPYLTPGLKNNVDDYESTGIALGSTKMTPVTVSRDTGWEYSNVNDPEKIKSDHQEIGNEYPKGTSLSETEEIITTEKTFTSSHMASPGPSVKGSPEDSTLTSNLFDNFTSEAGYNSEHLRNSDHTNMEENIHHTSEKISTYVIGNNTDEGNYENRSTITITDNITAYSNQGYTTSNSNYYEIFHISEKNSSSNFSTIDSNQNIKPTMIVQRTTLFEELGRTGGDVMLSSTPAENLTNNNIGNITGFNVDRESSSMKPNSLIKQDSGTTQNSASAQANNESIDSSLVNIDVISNPVGNEKQEKVNEQSSKAISQETLHLEATTRTENLHSITSSLENITPSELEASTITSSPMDGDLFSYHTVEMESKGQTTKKDNATALPTTLEVSNSVKNGDSNSVTEQAIDSSTNYGTVSWTLFDEFTNKSNGFVTDREKGKFNISHFTNYNDSLMRITKVAQPLEIANTDNNWLIASPSQETHFEIEYDSSADENSDNLVTESSKTLLHEGSMFDKTVIFQRTTPLDVKDGASLTVNHVTPNQVFDYYSPTSPMQQNISDIPDLQTSPQIGQIHAKRRYNMTSLLSNNNDSSLTSSFGTILPSTNMQHTILIRGNNNNVPYDTLNKRHITAVSDDGPTMPMVTLDLGSYITLAKNISKYHSTTPFPNEKQLNIDNAQKYQTYEEENVGSTIISEPIPFAAMPEENSGVGKLLDAKTAPSYDNATVQGTPNGTLDHLLLVSTETSITTMQGEESNGLTGSVVNDIITQESNTVTYKYNNGNNKTSENSDDTKIFVSSDTIHTESYYYNINTPTDPTPMDNIINVLNSTANPEDTPIIAVEVTNTPIINATLGTIHFEKLSKSMNTETTTPMPTLLEGAIISGSLSSSTEEPTIFEISSHNSSTRLLENTLSDVSHSQNTSALETNTTYRSEIASTDGLENHTTSTLNMLSNGYDEYSSTPAEGFSSVAPEDPTTRTTSSPENLPTKVTDTPKSHSNSAHENLTSLISVNRSIDTPETPLKSAADNSQSTTSENFSTISIEYDRTTVSKDLSINLSENPSTSIQDIPPIGAYEDLSNRTPEPHLTYASKELPSSTLDDLTTIGFFISENPSTVTSENSGTDSSVTLPAVPSDKLSIGGLESPLTREPKTLPANMPDIPTIYALEEQSSSVTESLATINSENHSTSSSVNIPVSSLENALTNPKEVQLTSPAESSSNIAIENHSTAMLENSSFFESSTRAKENHPIRISPPTNQPDTSLASIKTKHFISTENPSTDASDEPSINVSENHPTNVSENPPTSSSEILSAEESLNYLTVQPGSLLTSTQKSHLISTFENVSTTMPENFSTGASGESSTISSRNLENPSISSSESITTGLENTLTNTPEDSLTSAPESSSITVFDNPLVNVQENPSSDEPIEPSTIMQEKPSTSTSEKHSTIITENPSAFVSEEHSTSISVNSSTNSSGKPLKSTSDNFPIKVLQNTSTVTLENTSTSSPESTTISGLENISTGMAENPPTDEPSTRVSVNPLGTLEKPSTSNSDHNPTREVQNASTDMPETPRASSPEISSISGLGSKTASKNHTSKSENLPTLYSENLPTRVTKTPSTNQPETSSTESISTSEFETPTSDSVQEHSTTSVNPPKSSLENSFTSNSENFVTRELQNTSTYTLENPFTTSPESPSTSTPEKPYSSENPAGRNTDNPPISSSENLSTSSPENSSSNTTETFSNSTAVNHSSSAPIYRSNIASEIPRTSALENPPSVTPDNPSISATETTFIRTSDTLSSNVTEIPLTDALGNPVPFITKVPSRISSETPETSTLETFSTSPFQLFPEFEVSKSSLDRIGISNSQTPVQVSENADMFGYTKESTFNENTLIIDSGDPSTVVNEQNNSEISTTEEYALLPLNKMSSPTDLPSSPERTSKPPEETTTVEPKPVTSLVTTSTYQQGISETLSNSINSRPSEIEPADGLSTTTVKIPKSSSSLTNIASVGANPTWQYVVMHSDSEPKETIPVSSSSTATKLSDLLVDELTRLSFSPYIIKSTSPPHSSTMSLAVMTTTTSPESTYTNVERRELTEPTPTLEISTPTATVVTATTQAIPTTQVPTPTTANPSEALLDVLVNNLKFFLG